MANTKILQINLNHSKSATTELSILQAMDQYKIILIQEPWVHKNQAKGLQNKNGNLFVGTNTCNPRACIYISKQIDSLLLNQFSDRDHVTVLVSMLTSDGTIKKLLLVSAYFPIELSIPPPNLMMEKVLEYSKKMNIPIIYGCDSNAHHVAWGSRHK